MPFKLRKINHVREAPHDSYLFYSLSGGIFHLSPREYESFAIQWIGLTHTPPLTMDLSSAQQHALIFDLDLKHRGPHNCLVTESTLDWIDSILKNYFLKSVPHYTYIISWRENHGGVHIHLPEFVITHDDYILLCQSLQASFRIPLDSGEKYTLDILQNAMLSNAAKPNLAPYIPRRIVYVDECKTFQFIVQNYQSNVEQAKIGFKMRKNNQGSFYRMLLQCNRNMFKHTLKLAMMPVVVNCTPLYTATYHTIIGTEPSQSLDTVDVAHLTFRNGSRVHILKGKTLLYDKKNLLQCFKYLRIKIPQIESIETDNHAIKTWYQRFLCLDNGRTSQVLRSIPERLHIIHHMLRNEHSFLSQDSNPLKTVMQYDEGYFFLPVFFALCNHFQTSVLEIVEVVRTVVDERYDRLLDRLRFIDEQEISFVPTDITLNTIHYCCNHMYPKPKSMGKKLEKIIENNRDTILSLTTQDQIVLCLRNLQARHFPIQMFNLRNNHKRAVRYIWNFLTESWQEITYVSEIHDHMTNLWSHIRSFLIDYRRSGGLGSPDETLYDKLNISNVTAQINSDTSMERIVVQMDVHKWFLRLRQYGMLDLLTGHVGGIVPEFFMSDRRMGLDFTRERMIELSDNSPLLESVYAQLSNRQFLLRFLKNLLTNQDTSFYATAHALLQNVFPDVQVALGNEKDWPLVRSMLYFYINLGIYMSFDYDMMFYLMDVLTSTLIATNYERKFIVCKGITKNGKSVLFETLKAVFGGYYVGIQSENLMPVTQGNTAAPELALSLFSARIVTCEEMDGGKLNENRVKQITGNSHVTFRNMYEANAGGIPTAKMFANTNNYPNCRASEAFHDRTIAIPFDAHFVPAADVPSSLSEQVRTQTYPIHTNVIEQCYKGCFLMLYYHLKQHMNLKDGLMHLRKEPPYVVEFTKDYLIHTDIYMQFKMYMDVQIVQGSMTTLTMLKSAVRQYLKSIRNMTIHETDMLKRFEEEFHNRRKTNEQLTSPHYQSMLMGGDETLDEGLTFTNAAFRDTVEIIEDTQQPTEIVQVENAQENRPTNTLKRKTASSLLDEIKEERSASLKRMRMDAIVYYENVAIKNLK